MSGDQAHSKPDGYWDRAGEQGYGQAMYRSSDVETHVRGRVWQIAIDIAGLLGVPADGRVLDLGCGDGAFTNQMLAGHYRVVDGIDKSEAAIKRANAESRQSRELSGGRSGDIRLRFAAALRRRLPDRHIASRQAATPDIVRAMARRTDKMIVLEPNGSHLLRKAMEYTPSYRAAGEDSFRSKDLMAIFAAAGWRTEIWRRMNVFPNFTPGFICRWLKPIEPRIEASRIGNALCTVDMYGLTLAR